MKVFHVTLHCIFVQGGGKVVAIDLTSENKASQQKNEETLLPLLPRRPNSKPCEFFMKTGTCAYGSKCIWDHPRATLSLRELNPTRQATGETVCKPSDEQVAEVLLHLVRKSPGGQMSAASLCSTVYKQCAGAKCVIVDKYHGLKGFVSSSVLNRHVGFVPDEVC